MNPAHLKLGKGPAPSLTPLEEIELYAWYKAKKALGTNKTKAAQLGVSEGIVTDAIRRMKFREERGIRESRAGFRAPRIAAIEAAERK